MSITFQHKGVRYQEVWFDEPVDPGQDIIVGYQRPQCPAGVRGTPFHTLVLDLRQTTEQLLAAFDSDVRYELRRAEKDALAFEYLTEPSPYVADFCSFYNAFAAAKGLETLTPSRLLPAVTAGHLILTRIQKDDATLVWHAYYCVAGRSRLLHSASLFRSQLPAQRALTGRANRLLHWHDILEFRQRGYRVYDLGGWTPPEQADEAKARINDFKAGFGGRQVQEYHVTYPISAKGRAWLFLRHAKDRLRSRSNASAREQTIKPRICIVASDIWPVLVDDRNFSVLGGMEVQLSILARAFVQAGFPVTVVTKDFGQADGVVVDGVTVYRSHKPTGGLPVLRFFHPRLTSWWRALKRADADIYLQRSADLLTGVTGAFSRLHGRRFIYSGASDLDFRRNETWKLFQRWMGRRDQKLFEMGLKLADRIVAQHECQVADCAKWYGRTATRIANCYACAPPTMPQARDLVLWVATVKPLKRPELFLELARALPQLRFRMVGGPAKEWEYAAYETARETAATIANVEFTGFVPYAEVGAQFDQARLFVNTSDFEGFPNTFLQAWARGIPTVSFFDCGAQFEGRPVGFVCRDLAAMCETVRRLGENDELWEAESRRARAYFEANHSIAEAVERYSRLFQSVLDSKEGTGSHA